MCLCLKIWGLNYWDRATGDVQCEFWGMPIPRDRNVQGRRHFQWPSCSHISGWVDDFLRKRCVPLHPVTWWNQAWSKSNLLRSFKHYGERGCSMFWENNVFFDFWQDLFNDMIRQRFEQQSFSGFMKGTPCQLDWLEPSSWSNRMKKIIPLRSV